MRKRLSKKQGPEDINEIAYRVISEAIDEEDKKQLDGKNPAAVALGRMGGLKGGKARAQKLSPAERSRIASLAAQKRWEGKSRG